MVYTPAQVQAGLKRLRLAESALRPPGAIAFSFSPPPVGRFFGDAPAVPATARLPSAGGWSPRPDSLRIDHEPITPPCCVIADVA